jgi:tungstate transport system substrate-binding protein
VKFLSKKLNKATLIGISLVILLVTLSLLVGCSTPTPVTITSTQVATSTAVSTSTATATTTATTITTSTVTPPANPELILSSTTSVRDSGLMDKLIPIFQMKTGYKVKPIYNGTGAALALGAKGEADVLVVHSPEDEAAFMAAGNGVDRILIMHNDFIIVGPSADPAKVKGSATAVDAFKKIATAQAGFYSRGDKSGTDTKEKSIWKLAGVTQVGQTWYFEAKLGMGDLLRVASEKYAYTLTDRATYLANKKTLSLDILFEGDPTLLNVYHVITVNPKLSTKTNVDGANAFAQFMVGKVAQEIIGNYTDANGNLLFTPDGGKTDAALGLK